MVVNMEKDFNTIQRINRYMTESGNKIEKMDLVLNQLKMDLSMQESSLMTRNQGKEHLLQKLESIMVTLKTENIMGKENCNLLMKEKFMLEVSKMT